MKRVLIVDDDTDLLAALKSFLTKKGYNVTTTTSCNEGLDILYSVLPHVVLLDINVGSEDGRTMCKKIKNTAESQHIPVILISANHQALASYQEYGANASLPKPFDLPVLLHKIEETVSA